MTPLGQGAFRNKKPEREEPRKEKLRRVKSREKRRERSPEQPRATVVQRAQKSQQRHKLALHQLIDHFPGEQLKILEARTWSSRGIAGEGSGGTSGGTDHASVPNLSGTSGVEDKPTSE